jgi:succinate-acetate transporter protein
MMSEPGPAAQENPGPNQLVGVVLFLWAVFGLFNYFGPFSFSRHDLVASIIVGLVESVAVTFVFRSLLRR